MMNTEKGLATKDGLIFTYRHSTSDIKAIREACGNIDGEKKRSCSYERKRRAPLFKIEATDVWLDCGAQIGSFSLRAIQNGAKKAIAVEPEDDNHRLLVGNVAKNDYTSFIMIEKCAVVDHVDSEAKTYLYKTFSTYRHTLLPIKNAVGTQEVRCKTLQQIFEEYPDINACKIDIEGREFEVIRSVDWTKTNIQKLVFEYSFDHHPVMAKFHELVDYLKTQFAIVYHIPSLPGRDSVWDVKVTRGANGQLVWCIM